MGYKSSIKLFLILGSIPLICIGCASKRIYHWGNYENVIYRHYSKNTSPNEEIERLRVDISKSKENGKPLPPGFHAYLGTLYYEVGNFDLAQESFVIEKNKFPESTALMDRFLKKQSKK